MIDLRIKESGGLAPVLAPRPLLRRCVAAARAAMAVSTPRCGSGTRRRRTALIRPEPMPPPDPTHNKKKLACSVNMSGDEHSDAEFSRRGRCATWLCSILKRRRDGAANSWSRRRQHFLSARRPRPLCHRCWRRRGGEERDGGVEFWKERGPGRAVSGSTRRRLRRAHSPRRPRWRRRRRVGRRRRAALHRPPRTADRTFSESSTP
mmetsp:Transcript_27245/g.57288  ORF Transcript_27245/g.57288 Transcript_27245/m.57288 type:complete len:206 (-) Transcript_27245:1114-1731(-)